MKALSAILLPAGLILAALLCSLPATAAGARTPLLQPGKKSVYQRVLSHPGARLYIAVRGIVGNDHRRINSQHA